MDSKMTVIEAIRLREDLKANIEGMLFVFSTSTGLDVDVQASAGANPDGSGYAECGIQVNLPDKSPLAKDKVTG